MSKNGVASRRAVSIEANPVTDNTDLRETCSFDEVVKFAQGCVARQRLNVQEQVHFLRLEQFPVVWDQEGLAPKGPDVDPHHLKTKLRKSFFYFIAIVDQPDDLVGVAENEARRLSSLKWLCISKKVSETRHLIIYSVIQRSFWNWFMNRAKDQTLTRGMRRRAESHGTG